MRYAGLALALICVAVATPAASGAGGSPQKPCAKHEGSAKTACIRQLRRSRLAYPPRPTWGEFRARANGYEEATLRRIAMCEEGGSGAGQPWDVRWGFTGGTYSTAFGIANVNAGYITSTTGYAFPGRTPAEEALGALALARKFGFSAWGCF